MERGEDGAEPGLAPTGRVEAHPAVDVLQAGAIIASRYRLERSIGEGGMGVVWKATHVLTGRSVALKFLKPSSADPLAAQARFLREARAASAVNHPGLLPVHDVLQLENGTLCMVMDLLGGESFGARLARERTVPLPELAKIMGKVCAAVGAAHAAGIVHRDLKPDNVFLAQDTDGTTTVKVLDFGIAKLMAPEAGEPFGGAMTGTGAIMGSPFYMAPEQLFGDKALDHRADVWAIGVILYEALAGARPTQADSIGEVVQIVANRKIVPLDTRVTGLPEPVVDLVRRLLSYDRAERPADLREVVAVLATYGGGEIASFGSARPSSLPEVRTPGEARVDSNDVFAPTIGALASSSGRPDVQPPSAPPAVRSSKRVLAAAVLVLVGVSAALGAWGVVHAGKRAASVASAPSASSSAEATQRGTSRSSNPEAQRLFEEGMRSLYEGTGQAVPLLEAAVKADPGFGGAYLRLWQLVADPKGDAYEHTAEYHQRAVALQSSLSGQDRVLFDALDVADDETLHARLDAYLARYPDDPIAWFARQDETALAADRALARLPGFVPALAAKAYSLSVHGDYEQGARAVSTCLQLAPRSVECLAVRAFLFSLRGECKLAEADIRRQLDLQPGSRSGHLALASVLLGEGASAGAVAEALGDNPPIATGGPVLPIVRLPLLDGDFPEVERQANEVLARVAPSGSQGDHVGPVVTLVMAYTETGDVSGAGRVAADYLARSVAWKDPDVAFTGIVIAAAARTGAIENAEAERRKAALFQDYVRKYAADGGPRTGIGAPENAWATAYASGVNTRAEAETAILKLDALGVTAPPQMWPSGYARTLFLAGRTEVARPLHESRTRNCSSAFGNLFAWVYAHLELGETDEQHGDKASACAHYKQVFHRWGHAKPRSVSADEAQAHSKALSCPE